MHSMRKSIAFLLIVLLGWSPSIRGDEIVLKTGERIRGKVLNQSRRSMVIRTVRGRRTIPKKRIRQVLYGPFDPRRERRRILEARRKRSESKRLRNAKQKRLPGPVAGVTPPRPMTVPKTAAPSPGLDWNGALLRAAVLPGWGHYHLEQPRRAGLYGGLFLASFVHAVRRRNAFLDSRASYTTELPNRLAFAVTAGRSAPPGGAAVTYFALSNAMRAGVRRAEDRYGSSLSLLTIIYGWQLYQVYRQTPDRSAVVTAAAPFGDPLHRHWLVRITRDAKGGARGMVLQWSFRF